MKHVLLGIVRIYRGLASPLLPSSCRFYPTCSAYSEEAIARYGTIAGLKLTIRRVTRCHPWCEGGYDPVP